MVITGNLDNCELFRGFSPEDRSAALEFFDARVKSYKRGEFLHLSGDKMQRFGLVLEGTVQVYMDDINGEQMIMASVAQGNTFGESLCYLEVPESPVYIISVSDSSVLWLSADNLRRGGDDTLTRELRARFISMLARRTLSMNNRIQILSKFSIRAKLVTFFSQCADRENTTFSVNLDRQAMATYLGTDRSALSRELSRMKREGLIDYHKNSFRILRPIE